MNFKLQLSILFGGIALLFTSCAKPVEQPKPIDMDALKMEIQKMEDAFAAAEKAKDAAAVAAYYSDDAEISPSGEELSKGHYMSYFQKKDGKYVCVRDMNVSSTKDQK